MAVGVGRATVVSFILLLLFVWAHVASKDNPSFLTLMYSSFVFLGLATLLLVLADVEHASKRLRSIFYTVVAIAMLITIGVALSIASVPPGGTRHYFYITPENVEISLEYGWTSSGKPGYHGGRSQTILDIGYPVGEVDVWYELHGVHVYTNRSILSNLTVWFILEFWPNHYGPPYRSMEQSEKGTAIFNGTESYVNFRKDWFIIHWASTTPEKRVRLDKGYRISIYVGVELKGPNYGDLKATIPLYPGVDISDVQVSSQLQDGVAILLCGVFAGTLSYIPTKPIKPKLTRRFAPMLDRINRFLSLQRVTPKAFLKKCAECGREIPIASEECPFCKSKQP